MDFDDAIRAHVNWKVAFRAHIEGEAVAKLNVAAIEKDDHCMLGQWIDAESARCGDLPELRQLKIAHAQFHRCAGEVARRIVAGEKTQALELLGTGTDYMKASVKVASLLRAVARATRERPPGAAPRKPRRTTSGTV
jgi:hypothetical protein